MRQGVHVLIACLGSNPAVLPLVRVSHVACAIPMTFLSTLQIDVFDGAWDLGTTPATL